VWGWFGQPELHRSKQTVEVMRSAAYWRRLCPQLHVASKSFQARSTFSHALPAARQAELAASIQVRCCRAHTPLKCLQAHAARRRADRVGVGEPFRARATRTSRHRISRWPTTTRSQCPRRTTCACSRAASYG
jgi:hypothetical protein